MDSKITKVLDILHKHFADEEHQYTEFEPSDVEYFTGCMLYNHFAFSKAHHNLKTMDLSYDFLLSSGDAYDEALALVNSINFETEEEAVAFLQAYIKEAKAKYTQAELYLLDRLDFHVSAMAERYEKGVDVEHIDFENPLLRK
jgi:hypothetical protein